MFALVVDDDPAIRAFVQAILNAEDLETFEAENGDDAMELVRCLDGRLDLIITDIQMCGPEDGLRLVETVHRSYPHVPVILMSGYPKPETPHPFVPKPFSWMAMRAAIRHVFARPARVA